VDNAQFLVEVKNGVNELLEDDRCLVLLKEAVPFCVLEEIPLHHDLSHDAALSFSPELPQELYYIWVVALLQDASLSLQNLLLRH